MPYCITLRSRTDAKITGWYAGRSCLWSTDHTRQKRFDDPHDAGTVCHELRSLCPRNAKVINRSRRRRTVSLAWGVLALNLAFRRRA